MRRIPFIIFLLFALCVASYAQGGAASPAASTQSRNTEQEIKRINAEMHDLLLRGQKERLLSYFAEDFIGTDADGTIVSKDDILRTFTPPPASAKITREIKDFKFRDNGETVIINYLMIERSGATQESAQYVYTDVFVRRAGRWLMISSQATRAPNTRIAAKVNTAIYDAYVGDYETEGRIFSVRREGDKLIGIPPNGHSVELLPESETAFFVRGDPSLTLFEKDSTGRVAYMIFRNAGSPDIRLKKVK
jgi:ketosteroid isomerase-like protein